MTHFIVNIKYVEYGLYSLSSITENKIFLSIIDFFWFIHTDLPARLVLALGSDAKLDVVPGAMEYALPFSTLEDARVRIRLPPTNFILNTVLCIG